MSFNIKKLLNPDVYDHPVKNIELIETHISWVVLTGDYAYKIKKPVNFGFLDFSTLEKRKKYCEQELSLNRRLAPDIYLDVVTISGTPESPLISNGSNSIEYTVEYAVKMRQFPQSVQLDNMLHAGKLGNKHIDSIAQMVAAFHENTAAAGADTNYGKPERISQPVKENFEHISEALKVSAYDEKLSALKKWSESEFARLQPVFSQRKRDGFIKECHGDMHLRNLVWLNDKALAFDCIEFNDNLRWIDVISEIAFLIMDLQDRKQDHLAYRFLNAYLEITGDYEGLSILPFYLSYRAMVRAKVDALRIQQITDDSKNTALAEFDSYIALALRYAKERSPALIIMRGLSASGKSTVSQQILENTGAIRIRSDVERKRMFDVSLDVTAKTSNGVNEGIYTSESSEQTYEKLLELASIIINAGNTVFVDAAFLKQQQREPFKKLAKSRGVSFVIVEVTASHDVLRERIIARKNDVSDADLAVLEHQIAQWKALNEEELEFAVTVNTEKPLQLKCLLDEIKTLTD
ncbi:bifunctional aminoglycoside phosphotransferase/ATP-binding protein [uncultured Cocleimonas sp.]|uniref:bifunctional aminoglycoside phosphotransferase/ATP-binding protein n=1 Tax=uncultured Cocleimonas sp. TaxID=1051587 RepID=UPI002629AFB8|nr:bifunctional aminoglycoside phosphotransferase/ATP-binding protein [uncultured Cocleimonas sp.]